MAAAAPSDPVALPPLPEGINCPDCGYDLRSLTGPRCPECGFDLAIVRSQTSQIPWSRRGEIGRFKAYWQTVWLVWRHPKRLYIEIIRPVSYRDSQRFRWVTFLHAYIPLLVCFAAGFASDGKLPERDSLPTPLGVVVGIGLLLVVLPGASSYVLESRRLPVEQRNRAIALSYYTWAPLAAIPVVLLFFAAAGLAAHVLDPDRSDFAFYVLAICVLATAILPLLAILIAESRLELLARRVLREHGRAWLRVLCMNAVVLAALLLAATIPLGIFYFQIIWCSLR